MKSKLLFPITVLIALAGAAGWWVGRQSSHSPAQPAAETARKVLFYQSPMHPWIKSDRPGDCTICGMKLVPIYEGDIAATDEPRMVRLSPSSVSVLRVETGKVTRQALHRSIHVAGTIEDDDTTHRRLSAYIDGRVDKLMANYVGYEVQAGQPLASIYSPMLLVARSEYVLGLRQAPTPDRDATLAASRHKLRRMGLTLEQIEKLPQHTGDTFDIVAPITGTVVERKVYEGQYVKEGDVLFEIGDFSKMWFVFDLYERDLAWIRVGQLVEVTTPTVPGKVYSAPISFIDPTLVAATRSAKIRVILENPPAGDPGKHRHELLHRVYAEGVVKVDVADVLTVPRSAVLSPGGVPVVYVASGEGRYQPRRVRLGRAGDETWEVLDGVAEGEEVVTTGNLLIDAQAQLDRGGEEAAPVALQPVTLNPAQVGSARELFAAADALGAALAANDLSLYNQRIESWRSGRAGWFAKLGAICGAVESASQLAVAADLAEARQAFLPLSMAVTDLAVRVRGGNDDFADLKIFECPMTRTAVPSALQDKGRWLQLEAPIRNPFFGAAMLECGTELRP